MQDFRTPSDQKSNKLIIFLLVGGAVMMVAAGAIILKQNNGTPEKEPAPPKIEEPAAPKRLVIAEPTRPPLDLKDTETDTQHPEGTDSAPPEKRPKGQRRLSDPQMGTIDTKAVNGFMNARFGQVKACYEYQLKTKPYLEGKLDVNINISPSGKVTAVTVNRDTVHDAAMLGCVKRIIQGWKFPKPDGGRVVVAKTYSFKKKD